MAINSYPDNSGGEVNFPDQLIDPVSKFRVSNPENLIDTDFEYGLQPTKWETVELINNTPSFFSKSGDTTIDGISSIITNAGTREIIVKTELDHGLAVGIPINVTGTKSITADGAYIINSIPDPQTFTYLCKDNQSDTNSILDLYSSIITGEFFQGSQLRISDSDGIITDAEGTSILTVTTNTTHGFGENTPFYFLNLNSTVAQEFQAANTASKSFDASNSATAQTFDGSNSLSSVSIDWSNSATFGGTVSTITATDVVADRITVSHTAENFNNLPIGTPLYYSVSATGGYFNTNPRGVVFLKGGVLGTSSSTFQVSTVPDGSPIDITSNLSGTFQIANQARTFAGNNINPLTQTTIDVEVGSSFSFDGGNQGYLGAVQATPPNNTLTVLSYTGTAINADGASAADYYVGAMVLYSSTGAGATGLNKDTTYFITSVVNNGGGNYTFSVAALPGGAPISITTGSGSGTQTFSRIGISVDKDIVHIPNSSFSEGDMLEYSFPVDGRFDVEEVEQEKLFYFVDTAYDAHNYKLGEDIGFKPVVATGGTVLPDIVDKGRTWRVHLFTTVGSSNFIVSDPGKETGVEFLVVGGGGAGGFNSGGGGGGGSVILASTEVTAQTYTVTVGAGGAKRDANDSYSLTTTSRGGIGGSSSVFGVTATGGGGGGVYQGVTGSAGANGGGTGSSDTGVVTAGVAGVAPTLPSGVTGFVFAGNTGGPNNATPYQGGGGAGAGGSAIDRNGGNGVFSSIDGNGFYYGGGGGGGSWEILPGNGGFGGSGGGGTRIGFGGTAGVGGRTLGADGTVGERRSDSGGNAGANTGGGGGGATFWSEANGGGVRAGNGGSGIVIIRYPLTAPVELEPAVATGGTVSEILEGRTIYRIHTFTTVGTSSFVVSDPGSWNQFQYLIIAGGGGGGAATRGGGGGAGGLLTNINAQPLSLSSQTYSIVVGGGGPTRTYNNANGAVGGDSGGNSTAFGLTAIGGGGGGSSDPAGLHRDPKTGGSGGGGWYGDTGPKTGAAGTVGQGFKGGDGSNSPPYGGGGGGAGGVGGNANSGRGGFGGPGRLNNITGSPQFYAGGGSSSNYGVSSNYPGGIGGGGIGDNATTVMNLASTNGTPNTGGGGGASGSGGSGIVIVRYPIAILTSEEYLVASGGEVSVINSDGFKYAVHQFLNPGADVFRVSSVGSVSGNNTIEYLIVAGGGSGGGRHGGGGGGGGLINGSKAITAGSYPILVGDGGAAVEGNGVIGNNGGNSSFGGETAIGGGGGGVYGDGGPTVQNGRAGGSGGGSGYASAPGASNQSASTPGTARGFAGGDDAVNVVSGGGGGAGGAGGLGNNQGGDGGPGYQWLDGFYYAAGGGGGSWNGGRGGNGGIGGGGGGNKADGSGGSTAGTGGGFARNAGGSGGFVTNSGVIVRAGSGGKNTGSGGGGGEQSGYQSYRGVSGAGGSGIVIIRYKIGTA
jgi:hypothetical protein